VRVVDMNLRPRLASHTEETLHQFIAAHAMADGGAGVVVGLSGGIDSALVARLAADAIGPERVTGLLLPDVAYPAELQSETVAYAQSLGISHRILSIDTVERAVRELLPEVSDLADLGNVKARIRMILLYAQARREVRRVLGTGNKSELLLGYFTKYGDGGVDLLPLGDLYKTQVWELAEKLELPSAIRERRPTAGLWPGQTDEGELGLPYTELDQILYGFEQLLTASEIVARTGIPAAAVADVERRMLANRHKRRLPPIPKLSPRTIGVDWRE
jgi:NAD+ synthase